MIRHIVIYKFHNRTDEIVKKTKEVLYSMKGKVPQVIDMECGEDFLGSPRSFDFFLSVTLKDRQALADYQVDKYHVDVVKKHMHSVMKESASVDSEF
ncbi:MAG TPA: Dabb family protein [Clostridia bacterium]|jgi:hypothetical protein|nr:Dabb family protein [Clostridia bacterium]